MATDFQKKADKINEKRRAEFPLFADQVEQTTADREFWRWRRNVSQGVERGEYICGPATVGLRYVRLQTLTRLARRCLGDELFEKLDSYCRHTYPSVNFWIDFWREVLVGKKRVVFAWKRINDPSLSIGFRCVEDGVFPPDGWTPPITEAELNAMYPPAHLEKGPLDHPDGGLMERTCTAIHGEKP